jgi:diacylglycerol kinase (ATP)
LKWISSCRTGLIFNPLGGQFRKRDAQIRSILADLPGVDQIEATSLAEFDQAVRILVAAEVEWLIVVGGDGTLQGVISCLFTWLPSGKWPELTIVPGGTTNMTALDLGMHDSPEKTLIRIKQCLQRSGEFTSVKRPVLRIEQAGSANVYGMLFGLGLITRGVKFSRSQIKQLGITGNIFTIMIVLRSIIGTFLGRPQAEWAPVRITQVDNAGIPQEKVCTFALVSTLERLLLGIRPYWGQEAAPLHVTLVRQHSKKFWYRIWPLIMGRGHHLKEEEGYISYNTSLLEIWLDDEYIVDGELYRAASQHGPVRISADGPLVFRVL